MALPRIVVRDREIILLSGFDEKVVDKRVPANVELVIESEAELRRSAKRHRNAVAFGYVAGKWVVAA